MKYLFNCLIGFILVFFDSLLSGYYNLCRSCGRVISYEKNTCPYCSDIQRGEFKDIKKDLENK